MNHLLTKRGWGINPEHGAKVFVGRLIVNRHAQILADNTAIEALAHIKITNRHALAILDLIRQSAQLLHSNSNF